MREAAVAAAMTDRLFVYGTLRRGYPHPMAKRLAAEATHEGRATWQGRLFDLGDHAAAVAADDPGARVHGDVYRVSSVTLAWLDLYEEVDRPPRPEWFVRERTEVRAAGSGAVTAWIYRFDGAVAGFDPVPDGDFVRHRAALA